MKKTKLALSRPLIHVAGSNGKGCTCFYLALLASKKYGSRCGTLFNSFAGEANDAIWIGDQPLKEKEFLKKFEEHLPLYEKYNLTGYEILVDIAYRVFEEKELALAIVECGMGALGDWGAHILDTAHEFLDLGLPTEVNPLYLKDHNPFFFPMSSTILFRFPKRGDMPSVDVTWYDGLDNIPAVPEGYGVSELDPNIPTVAGGKIQPAKLNPGKEIYSKELTFKGGSHGSTLSIIPSEKAKEMESRLPEVPKSPSNHYANFLLSCMGKEKTRSPFHIAGPLSQVFCLGVLSQRLNRKLVFDRDTKQITNDPEANRMLCGLPPRKGWEQYYKV